MSMDVLDVLDVLDVQDVLDVLWMSGCPQCGCPGCPGCLGCHLKVFAPPNLGNGIIFKSIKIKMLNKHKLLMDEPELALSH